MTIMKGLTKPKQATNVRKSASLWCHVVRRATKCSRCLVTEHAFLAHSKISDLHMSVRVQHHIVQLQVSVI